MRRTNSVDPWRAPIIVAQIPEIGVRRELTADKATREALANIAGLREVVSARAVFDITPQSSGRVHLAGHLSARVGQTCVVTLDPIDNDIEEGIDLVFAPPEQIGQPVDRPDNEELESGDAEALDEIEPIENGIIDLGRLATDILYLAIDPYPRKPGAVFEPQIVADDPADHPFAALEALRRDAKGTKDG